MSRVFKRSGSIYAVDDGDYDDGTKIIEIDPADYSVIGDVSATVEGQTISRILDIAYNQVAKKFYIIYRVEEIESDQIRFLGTVNVKTGVVKKVMMVDWAASITCGPDRFIYLQMADANDPDSILYKVDPRRKTRKEILQMQSRDSVRVRYNFHDDLIYHWSIDDEEDDIGIITSINPRTKELNKLIFISGTDNNERINGALYLSKNSFLIANDDKFFLTTRKGENGPQIASINQSFDGFAQAFRAFTETPLRSKRVITFGNSRTVRNNF
tara:strand:- start:1381 stop:2190 length:810 start_codon:yes stop_codon:yes gene_type:complete